MLILGNFASESLATTDRHGWDVAASGSEFAEKVR
jgi:hypothetical protein